MIVAEDDPERFLGTIGWSFHLPPPLQIADVGYSVHPDSRGHGIAGRALRTLTRWLTEDADGPQVARVQLDHSIENPASCRTALAAGFEREGVRTRLPAPAGRRRPRAAYDATTCACTGSSPLPLDSRAVQLGAHDVHLRSRVVTAGHGRTRPCEACASHLSPRSSSPAVPLPRA